MREAWEPVEDLLALAAARGLRVVWRDVDGRNGEFRAPGLIVLDARRPGQTQKVTLAHELGHAYYGHTWSCDARVRRGQEAAADRYAANLLITPAAYAAAERLVGCHAGALARELGVTARLVELWREQRAGQQRAA